VKASGFTFQFSQDATIHASDVAAWLGKNATLATRHSQRSLAELRFSVPDTTMKIGLFEVINLAEMVLGTRQLKRL
jgi:GTP cyclohydrolase I